MLNRGCPSSGALAPSGETEDGWDDGGLIRSGIESANARSKARTSDADSDNVDLVSGGVTKSGEGTSQREKNSSSSISAWAVSACEELCVVAYGPSELRY